MIFLLIRLPENDFLHLTTRDTDQTDKKVCLLFANNARLIDFTVSSCL